MEPLFSPDMHVFYEHTSIPLAIYYVDETGKFRAYLVSEGICDMYGASADEILTRLNGPEPFVNIPEKEEMIKAVKEFSENGGDYNVVFHEYVGKDRKLITLHGVGKHEYTRDGRRFSVVRYDEISDKSRRFLFRDEAREIEAHQKLLYDIDDAIARSFTSVIYVDTADQVVNVVRLNRFGKLIEEEALRDPHLRNVMDIYVRTFVYRDDAAEVLRFGDLDYVRERLRETNPLFHTFRTIRDGKMVYFRLKIIPFDNGSKIVYGFEHYDAQIREKLARQSEHETQMTLLAGLSCEYEAIWLVDAAIHHARLIRNNMKDPACSEAMTSIKEGSYDTIVGTYIDRYVVAEDRERLYQLSSLDNLMRNTKEDEIYHINYSRINPAGMKNYLQLCIARVTDDMGVVRFVCGFRNIDAIIEEEKNRNLLYSMAHVDHMTNVNNRRTFDEQMDTRIGEKIADDMIFFSFDLNELKNANDTRGHAAGDELIIGAADCMKAVLGPYGDIYRTGGDEFSALVNIPPGRRAEVVARLKEKFESWRGRLYPTLSISMGYVCASENPNMTVDDMRREAERRMYAQKSDYYMKEDHDRRRSRNHG